MENQVPRVPTQFRAPTEWSLSQRTGIHQKEKSPKGTLITPSRPFLEASVKIISQSSPLNNFRGRNKRRIDQRWLEMRRAVSLIGITSPEMTTRHRPHNSRFLPLSNSVSCSGFPQYTIQKVHEQHKKNLLMCV